MDANSTDPRPLNLLSEMNDQIEQRVRNYYAWLDEGVKPFGERCDGVISTVAARLRYDAEKDSGGVVTIAGRLTSCRSMGKSMFADLRDSQDRLQVYVQKNVIGDGAFARFARLDLGDIVAITGEIFKTRAGEITVRVQEFRLLSKALRPLPEKYHGLADQEVRYRQRYLDLISNPDSQQVFRQRFAIVREIRRYLEDRDYLEVETPMMQPLPGGATARPFKTHYNALNCPMYLRIAPELYLKRLLVGGFERVFEMNRNFRNEGLSPRHNPEFTMLEVYAAYSDCRGMMELVEGLVTTVAQKVLGTLVIKHREDRVIDLTPPWRRVPYRDLVREHLGAGWFELSAADKLARLEAAGLALPPTATELEVTHELYEKTIEPTLIQPTFVTRLPKELVPLAKVCEDDPTVVDVYELEINGQELSPGYSELNHPLEQRARFMEQIAAGQDPTNAEAGKIDEDFLLALEHGMPPAGGMGLGIDRLVMLLTAAPTIRDVILFPQLRPRV